MVIFIATTVDTSASTCKSLRWLSSLLQTPNGKNCVTAFVSSHLNLSELPGDKHLSTYPAVMWYLTEVQESSNTHLNSDNYSLSDCTTCFGLIGSHLDTSVYKNIEKYMDNVNRKCLVTPFLWAIGAATTGQVASPHLCTPAQLRQKHPLSLCGFTWSWSSADTTVCLRYSKTVPLLNKALAHSDTWGGRRHSSSTTWRRMVKFNVPAG